MRKSKEKGRSERMSTEQLLRLLERKQRKKSKRDLPKDSRKRQSRGPPRLLLHQALLENQADNVPLQRLPSQEKHLRMPLQAHRTDAVERMKYVPKPVAQRKVRRLMKLLQRRQQCLVMRRAHPFL
jgi:hypothetical protein